VSVYCTPLRPLQHDLRRWILLGNAGTVGPRTRRSNALPYPLVGPYRIGSDLPSQCVLSSPQPATGGTRQTGPRRRHHVKTPGDNSANQTRHEPHRARCRASRRSPRIVESQARESARQRTLAIDHYNNPADDRLHRPFPTLKDDHAPGFKTTPTTVIAGVLVALSAAALAAGCSTAPRHGFTAARSSAPDDGMKGWEDGGMRRSPSPTRQHVTQFASRADQAHALLPHPLHLSGFQHVHPSMSPDGTGPRPSPR